MYKMYSVKSTCTVEPIFGSAFPFSPDMWAVSPVSC